VNCNIGYIPPPLLQKLTAAVGFMSCRSSSLFTSGLEALDMFLGLNNYVREAKVGRHQDLGGWPRSLQKVEAMFRENATDGSVLGNLTEKNNQRIGCCGSEERQDQLSGLPSGSRIEAWFSSIRLSVVCPEGII
jgi:hypothetical protein